MKRYHLLKWINYLLLINFINLSANFYHASAMDSTVLENYDPIDSLTEFVLEYVLEMDDETIPDTEVPHEKRKLIDVKIILEKNFTYQIQKSNKNSITKSFYYEGVFKEIDLEQSSPPPKLIA
ncbi:hypothetical protein [Aquiflexum sp.]|uniref:hypothetical protein n=1 Tax=Aquiflexum sp. TaxID=1872584 RepID=UPI003593F9C7